MIYKNVFLSQLFQFNWNYIKYMSIEMESHGDSGLVYGLREEKLPFTLDTLSEPIFNS